MSHGYVPHTDVSTLQITAMATAFLFFLMFGFLDKSEFRSDFLSNFHSSSSKINTPNNQNSTTKNENATFRDERNRPPPCQWIKWCSVEFCVGLAARLVCLDHLKWFSSPFFGGTNDEDG